MGFADAIGQAIGRRRADPPQAAMTDSERADDTRVSPGLQAQRNQDRLRILQQEFADNPDDPALKSELARAQGSTPINQQSAGGFADSIAKAIGQADSTVKPARRSLVDQIPGMPPSPPEPAEPAVPEGPTLMDRVRGARTSMNADANPNGLGEAILTGISGTIAQPIGAVAGILRTLTGGKYGTQEGIRMGEDRAKEVADSLTYQPKTQLGNDIMSGIRKIIDVTKMQGMGPTEAITLAGVAAGQGMLRSPSQPSPVLSKLTPVRSNSMDALMPERAAASSTANSAQFGSVGAAAADNKTQARAMASAATPEMQAIVDKATKKGNVDLGILKRHVEADSLPIPVQLTKGQATQDIHLISEEMNKRGASPKLGDRFNQQNKALTANVDAIRENAAPDVFAQTKPEHGGILIDAYKAKDAALNKGISANYKALTDANGGQLPLDVGAFVKSADAALHKELLFDHVPPAIQATIKRLNDNGSMTFENFESLRTRLAAIQRSNVDGNVKAAAGVIRNALEDMPLPEGAAGLKPLADQARAAAKARFDLLRSDPAYNSVVTGKATEGNFIDKYVLNGDLKAVQTMKNNLAADQTAQQAMSSGAINHLKGSAGIVNGEGTFSQAGFNKALDKIRQQGKLNVVFPPEQAKQIETLGNVARYTQIQPKGSYVNNSGTLVGALAEGAKTTAEGAANVAAKGVPIGTWTRKLLQGRANAKALNETLQPGAGILLKNVK